MKTCYFLVFLALAAIPLAGENLSDEFSSIDKNRWTVLGRCALGSGTGIYLGPEQVMWAISGLKSVSPVGSSKKKIKITAEFSNFKVDKDAPREGTNVLAPSDINVSVDLTSDPKHLFFQTGRPATMALLTCNREKNEIWCGVQSKAAGAPRSSGENLANSLLGPAKDAKVKVVLESAGGYSVTATFFLNGVPAWSWSGSSTDPLGEKVYLGIYQQNMLSGCGSVRLDKVSIESSD